MSTAPEFYRTHSAYSDPGTHAAALGDIPADPARIAQITQKLVYHYMADPERTGWHIPPERLPEVDTRYAEKMLGRILAMDARPLMEARPAQKRILGCCRDFVLLFCSIARHKGIPTRARYGFGAYFMPGFYLDHVVAEYWNGDRWVMIDPEMTPAHIELFNIGFDVHDMPPGQFLVGAEAWHLCRSSQADPGTFCVAPDVPVPRGLGYVAVHLLLDLAALNKVEMLCWDTWADATVQQPEDPANRALLDQVAEATPPGAVDLARVRALFNDERLKVPATVHCWSPAAAPQTNPQIVALAQRSRS